MCTLCRLHCLTDEKSLQPQEQLCFAAAEGEIKPQITCPCLGERLEVAGPKQTRQLREIGMSLPEQQSNHSIHRRATFATSQRDHHTDWRLPSWGQLLLETLLRKGQGRFQNGHFEVAG